MSSESHIFIINSYKHRTNSAMNLFIQNLSHIPEDKLSWKPTLTAKSALEIAAHCAGYSAGFAMIIQNGRFPEDVNEFTVPVQERIESIKTVQ